MGVSLGLSGLVCVLVLLSYSDALCPNNCTVAGTVRGLCAATNECFCFDGFGGSDCSINGTCPGFNALCSNHGNCSTTVNSTVSYATNTTTNITTNWTTVHSTNSSCACDVGYTGADCSVALSGRLRVSLFHTLASLNTSSLVESLVALLAPSPNTTTHHWIILAGPTLRSGQTHQVDIVFGIRNSPTQTGQWVAAQATGADVQRLKALNIFEIKTYNATGHVNVVKDTNICPNACSGSNGWCVVSTTMPAYCQCEYGYGGSNLDCAQVLDCQTKSDCNSKGVCIRGGACSCDPGWTGADCSQRACPGNCTSHGTCTANATYAACTCSAGWYGADCSKASCPALLGSSCANQGYCLQPNGTCLCDPFYRGSDCSEPSCPGLCSGHGVCNEEARTCTCAAGWFGSACAAPICSGTPQCSGHGQCNIDYTALTATCLCDPGYDLYDCSFKQCPANCTGRGTCLQPQGECLCDVGFYGTRCDNFCPGFNSTINRNCSAHGDCVNNVCDCYPGWVGAACALRGCKNNCTNHGVCDIKNGTCHCLKGWSGVDCSVPPACPENCAGHGTCINSVCFCDQGWGGTNCSKNYYGCSTSCNFHGDCINQQCFCYDGWKGGDCATAANEVLCLGPYSGPFSGGSDVVFSTNGWQVGYVQASSVTCMFGADNATVTYSALKRKLTCTSPAVDAVTYTTTPTVHVGVYIDGVLQNPDPPYNDASFTFYATPTVASLDPAYSPIEGGATITLIGTNFLANLVGVNEYRCRFGNGVTQIATRIDDFKASCKVPRNNDTLTYTVEIAPNGVQYSTSGVSLSYYKTLGVHPACGPFARATTVTIAGVNIAGGSAYQCKFNNDAAQVSSGTYSAGHVVCPTVVTNVNAPVAQSPIALSLDGVSWTTSGSLTHIQLYTEHSITALSPAVGPASGGAILSVFGTGFFSCNGLLAVKVGNVLATNVTLVNSTIITVVVPPSASGTGFVSVSAALNGQQYVTATAQYYYHAALSVASLSPPNGPVSGSTSVTVAGAGFESFASARCVYRHAGTGAVLTLQPVTYLDAMHMLCVTPAGAAGAVRVEITLNGLTHGGSVSDSQKQFSYDPLFNLTNIEPASGPAAGGTQVSVWATNLVNATGLSCKFGADAATLVTFVNASLVLCTAPAYAGTGSVDVAVTLNGQQYSASVKPFHYFDDVAPATTFVGPTAGGTVVTSSIVGLPPAFTGLFVPRCRFGASTVAATYTGNVVTCGPAPSAVSAGAVAFGVSLDSVSYTSGLQYTYYVEAAIASLSTASGPDAGSTLITINGTNFLNRPGELKVRFVSNVTLTPAVTFVSSTLLVVHSPANVGQTAATVSVTNNNQQYSATTPFTYYAQPTLVSFAPVRVPTDGSGTLTITGAGFFNAGALMLCKLHSLTDPNKVVAATYVSSTSVTCPAVSGFAAGVVNVSLTFNNQQYTNALPVAYYTALVASAVDPPSGLNNVDTPVKVLGSNFINVAELRCKFDSTVVAATYTSASEITCIAPNITTNTLITSVNVQTTVDLLIWTPTGLTYSYYLAGAGCPGNCTNRGNCSGIPPTCTCQSGFTGLACDSGPALVLLSPKAGPVDGGTALTAQLTVPANVSLSAANAWTCTFNGSFAVNASVNLATNVLTCAAPAMPAGTRLFGITLDGIAIASVLTFESYVKPNITALSAHYGVLGSAITVTLTGTNFRNDIASTCKFGSVLGDFYSYISATQASCRLYATAAAHTTAAVSGNGVDYSASTIAFAFTPGPTLNSTSPVRSPAATATTITVVGTGFVNTGDARIRWGSNDVYYYAPAHFVNSMQLTAAVNPSLPVGTHALAVTFNMHDHTALSWTHTVYQQPSVTGVSPNVMPVAGGRNVTVTGTNFVAGHSELYCAKFGSTVVSGFTYVSPTQLVVLAPTNYNGGVSAVAAVEVSFNCQDYTAHNKTLDFFAPATVTALASAVGDNAGGSTVTVSGTNFRAFSTLACKFGAVASPLVTFISSTQIACKAPAKAATTTVAVEVSLDGGVWTSNAVSYTYFDMAALEFAITPAAGPTSGATSVTLAVSWGANAVLPIGASPFAASGQTIVKFGANWGTVTSITNTQIVVTAPASSTYTGKVRVAVSFNMGQVWSLNSIDFAYYVSPTLLQVVPSRGPITGGTNIFVALSAFQGNATVTWADFLPAIKCRFTVGATNSPPISAIYDGATGITCTAPVATSAATATLSVALNTLQFSGSASFEYVPVETVTAVTPDLGLQSGGTVVTVTGTNFLAGDVARCSFSYNSVLYVVNATYVSATQLTCTTPSFGSLPFASPATVRVSLNNQQYSPTSKTFLVHQRPTISGHSPKFGFRAGGTVVTVVGTGFDTTANAVPKCFFGAYVANATIISSSALTCTTPAAAADGAQQLQVSSNGLLAEASVASAGITFTYSLVTVTSILPSGGPSSQATVVDVTGTGFVNSPQLRCRYSTATATKFAATYVSPTVVRCTVPAYTALTTGSHSLDLSIDDQSFTANNIQFTKYADPAITSFAPTLGLNTGGQVVTITGTNFVNRAGVMKCRFGTVAVAATYVSATVMTCAQPAQAQAGYLPLELTFNDQQYTGNNITFLYYSPLTVSRVHPVRGPAAGGTKTEIHGTGFLQLTTLGCKYGAGSFIAATYVSSTKMVCAAPAGTAGASVAVEVTMNNVQYSANAVQFVYYANPSVTSITPTEGSTTTPSSVTVTGTNFVSVGGSYCSWQGLDLVTNFTYTSATTGTCLTPIYDQGVYRDVYVSFNDNFDKTATAASNGGRFKFKASAPTVTFKFTSSLSQIVVRFSTSTNRGGTALLTAGCSDLLAPATIAVLGTNPVCKWQDNKLFEITIGASPTVTLGTSVALKSGLVIEREFEFSYALDLTAPVTVARPDVLPLVEAVINAPASLGSCDSSIYFDARQSKGTGGRAFVTWWTLDMYRSKVTDPTLTSAQKQAVLDDVRNELNRKVGLMAFKITGYNSTGNATYLSSGLLPEGAYYVQLSLTSWIGSSSVSTHRVVKNKVALPLLFIDGVPIRAVPSSQGLTLMGVTGQSVCPGAVNTVNMQYQWDLFPRTAGWQAITFKRGLQLFIPGYTLAKNTRYTLVMTAIQASVSLSTSIEIKTKITAPAAFVSGGSRDHPVSEALVLDASTSVDLDVPPAQRATTTNAFTYVWTCTATLGACPSLGSTGTITIAANTLTATAVYTFTATVSKTAWPSAGSTSDSIKITAKEDRPPLVTLNEDRKAKDHYEINANDDLKLFGTCTARTGTTISSWSYSCDVPGIVTDDNMKTKVSKTGLSKTSLDANFKLRKNVLTSGGEYKFKLTCCDSSSVCGHSEILQIVNRAPTSGVFTVTPTTGTAMTTVFTITGELWTDKDVDMPLSYSFYYLDEKNKTQTIVKNTDSPSVETTLPERDGSTTVEINAHVSDRYGAVTVVQKWVTVVPITGTQTEVTTALTTRYSDKDDEDKRKGNNHGRCNYCGKNCRSANANKQRNTHRRLLASADEVLRDKYVASLVEATDPSNVQLSESLLNTLAATLEVVVVDPLLLSKASTASAMMLCARASTGFDGKLSEDAITSLSKAIDSVLTAAERYKITPVPSVGDTWYKGVWTDALAAIDNLSRLSVYSMVAGQDPAQFQMTNYQLTTYLYKWADQASGATVYATPPSGGTSGVKWVLPSTLLAGMTTAPTHIEVQCTTFLNNPYGWTVVSSSLRSKVSRFRIREQQQAATLDLGAMTAAIVMHMPVTTVLQDTNIDSTTGARKVIGCASSSTGLAWTSFDTTSRQVYCTLLGKSDKLGFHLADKVCPAVPVNQDWSCSITSIANPDYSLDEQQAGCDGVAGSSAVKDLCGWCDGGNNGCRDCAGVPLGTNVIDPCGICGGTGITCAGCDGVPNSGAVKDRCNVCSGTNQCVGCDGIPFSGLVIDRCGSCGGDDSTCSGCDGVPGSGKAFDRCGECLQQSPRDSRWDQCIDCFGVVRGTFVTDRCGICGGSDACVGCDNAVNSGKVNDRCGVCAGSDACVGCDNVVNSGTVVDRCGVCGGTDGCVDCAGVPFGGKVNDQCNVCGGNGMSCLDCENTLFGTKVFDRCQVCGGTDACVGCDNIPKLPPATPTVFDACTPPVCGGDGSTCTDCNGVPNGTDQLDRCLVCGGADLCIDCNNVPFGTSSIDICNICGGDGVSCLGCDSVPFSGLLYDLSGVCGGNNWCDGVANSGKIYDRCGVCGGSNACVDCANVPFGTSANDRCGVCDGTNACVGCDDVPNSGKVIDKCDICGGSDACLDCQGVRDGTSLYDMCGVCDGSNACLDCFGVPHGTATVDLCGVCGGSNACLDCFGVVGGTASEDLCGVCNGQNACLDCFGVVNGPATVDRCGVCGGTNACIGCDNQPGNKAEDRCGVCGGNNACVDCLGVVNGGNIVDLCFVCGGNNDCFDCLGNPNGPARLDQCGVCGGTNACLGCDLVPNSGKVNDRCGVCGGDDSTCVGCDGLVATPPAKEDQCQVCKGQDLCLDCAGVPFGTATRDVCDVCNGPGLQDCSCCGCDGVPKSGQLTDLSGVCGGSDWCDGVANSGKVWDQCEVCGGANACFGCDGKPNSGLVFDDCGVCGGTNGLKDLCGECNGDDSTCAGCDGVPNSGKVYNECGQCGVANSLACIERVSASMSIAIPYASVIASQSQITAFIQDFRAGVSRALGIPATRVLLDASNIVANQQGGTDVLFTIKHDAAPSPSTLSNKAAMQKFQRLVATPGSVLYTGGGVVANIVATSFALSCATGCDGLDYCGNTVANVAILDPAGVCGGNGWCDGLVNSGRQNDYCGECGGDNSTCTGCDGVVGSALLFDSCGVCGGDNACLSPSTPTPTVPGQTPSPTAPAATPTPSAAAHSAVVTVWLLALVLSLVLLVA